MHYAAIKYLDIANGPGARTCLFVSGCTHGCKECFNREAWSFTYGNEFDEEIQTELLESLKPRYCKGITILGGEPMEPANQRGLVSFLERVRREYPNKSIWMYTGDIFEDLIDSNSSRHTEVTTRILNTLDVLVDGPFISDLHDITLRFKGSSNQRLIDMKKTLEEGRVVIWKDESIYETHGLV